MHNLRLRQSIDREYAYIHTLSAYTVITPDRVRKYVLCLPWTDRNPGFPRQIDPPKLTTTGLVRADPSKTAASG